MPASSESQGAKPRFDNAGQYSRQSILRYEKIFGDGYVSTGGPETTLRLRTLLGPALKPGAKVLDVGSGLGGAAFDLARMDQVDVTGIDLAEEMIAITQERAALATAPPNVRFILGDVLTENFPEPFDILWSRDALMHVPNKPQLYKRLFDLLKPGGHLVITDYARREGDASPEFNAYATKTGYHLVDIPRYGQLLKDAGFSTVNMYDVTPDFLEILQKESQHLTATKAQFLAEFPESDWSYLIERWAMKCDFIRSGDMKWAFTHSIK